MLCEIFSGVLSEHFAVNSAVSSVSASCSLTPRAPGVKPEKRNSGWGTFPTTREREKYRLPQAVRQVLESCPAVGTGNDGSDGVTNWKSDALWEDDCISESVCARNPTAELLSIQAHPPTTPRGWCGPGAISQYNNPSCVLYPYPADDPYYGKRTAVSGRSSGNGE